MSVFEDLEVRFTPPDKFNDPFEAYPRVRRPKRESVKRLLQPGEDLDELMKAAVPFFQEQGPDYVLAEVSELFGVLSLAAAKRNPLLWGHYAAGHQGFAVGFDPEHLWLQVPKEPQPPIDAIRRVAYRWRRPQVDIGYVKDFRPGQVDRLAEAMLFTKYVSWRYEKEWRLVRPLRHADRVIDKNGEAIHLFNVPHGAVTEVVLGARSSPALRDRVSAAAAHYGVPVYQARLSKSTYALDVQLGTA